MAFDNAFKVQWELFQRHVVKDAPFPWDLLEGAKGVQLAEKGLEWKSHLMALNGDQLDPAYLKLNPNGVVPTLVHDGNVIVESTVIMHYLDDTFPAPPLMPRHPLDRTRAHLFKKLMDEYIHPACIVFTFATP